jgi:hypothetical protein
MSMDEEVAAMREQGKAGNGRREFIKLAGLGAVAAPVGLAAAVTPVKAEAPDTSGQRLGYRETEHVRKVYEVARF